MAVDLLTSYRTKVISPTMEESSVEEAASACLQSMEKLLKLLSQQHDHQFNLKSAEIECRSVTDVAVTKFRRMISLLGRTRTGHARFRRSPLPSSPQISNTHERFHVTEKKNESDKRSPLPPRPHPHHHRPISATNSLVSSLTCDTDKRPLCSSLKRKCSLKSENGSSKCGEAAENCDCSKRRKLRVKKTVRVPVISSKTTDVPSDEFLWRKYGQKPIKGSPYPRGYYRCSHMKGCPARKHVERAMDDPAMLVVTYEGEHNHAHSVSGSTTLVVDSSLNVPKEKQNE
eukprot:TRINITY_DN147_c1_g1_i1.p1 TRINITY_DN147_c1_g1~~TRINITY_DN147_c1_g1_i1.p1  ORF type:complete len:287 (+),score=42.40 TRINITY_DN147_c1_g1_i1:88-948(+)